MSGNDFNPHNLKHDHPRVPQSKDPLFWESYWDGNARTERCLKMIEGQMVEYERYLPAGASFDEVAILVTTIQRRYTIEGELERDGWEHFNEAEDMVYTNPFGTRYSVEYHFLRHPDRAYRLEVMQLARGVSPLHHSLNHVARSYMMMPVVHLSFKPPAKWVEEFGTRGAYALTVDYLQEKGGLVHAQTCQSTYGVFSYWIPCQSEYQLYLKPRVNLRDEGGEGGAE